MESKDSHSSSVAAHALAVRISEVAEISTRRIVNVTWILVLLTFALLILTIALYEDARTQAQRDALTKQHGTNGP